ncbi:MAG: Kef family K(+) transporter [Methylobacterium sp.]|nr:Kef family K(+) transporter [Methylobacterium sp.]MCA3605749.1 Kef family K(+) transporter [Methylobacterium sp.]MCA3608391.1 Kef family K(+) transporter [Methylobacterium sp.]MCA3617872.1 Kef family K(+) transporter [Methylobacterium sp.]MCA3621187.1 Kef family K(+) transporter [Methylobacterium sp.]
MQHDTPLIATIAVGLGLAFVLGVLAQRFRLPPIAGYLVAGILVGPFTPGFVADQKLAVELAEIGVILLMFGVGLHFSLKDLLSVRAIAVPGALGQIAVATMLGMGLASMMGWGMGAGLVFGLALSVASTVVLLRALQERRQVETEKGRIAVGWLIVEDLVMVVTLVLVPPLAALLGGKAPVEMASPGLAALLGVGPVWSTLLITAAKLGLFVTSMLVFGRKLIPWMLHYVAHTGSRELFRLAVLAIALGVAFGSAKLFGVSFALGAFFAGMVLAESPLSHQAAKETLPLRDAFAVLFFVSVGMLLDPRVLANHPFAVIATFLIITVGKSVAAYLIVRAFGYSNGVAMTISASLAQIGEFSFILIVLAVQLAIVPQAASDFVVAGSILSILVNPLMFLAIDRIYAQRATGKAPVAPAAPPAPPEEEEPTRLTDHAVLVGHGRVGSRLRADLQARGIAHLVVEEEAETVEVLKTEGVEAFLGPCGEPAMLERLNLAGARYLISAIPDAFEAGHLVEAAKAANPGIWVVARAHSAEAVEYLRKVGADKVLMGEEELAKGMAAALG